MVVVTAAAVVFSVGISASIDFLSNGQVSTQAIVFAIIIPGIISPLFSILFLRLVFQLEDLQTQMHEIAITDDLTRAFNRRHWIALVENELARARRYGSVFSIIIFDVDNFKWVNDTYGHVVGDHVLIQLSKICQSQSRQNDVFARFGGEEFVFLLPQVDKSEAWIFAERIRTSIAEARFSFNLIEFGVTVSVGVITFDVIDSNLSDLLIRVDKALYAAKNSGKDRTIVAPGPADLPKQITVLPE